MDICRETVNKIIETLFPRPKYKLHEYMGDSGFTYCIYKDSGEVFSFSFYRAPEIFFTKPVKYPDEFNTLNEVFTLDQVGLYSYEIIGFKNDSE